MSNFDIENEKQNSEEIEEIVEEAVEEIVNKKPKKQRRTFKERCAAFDASVTRRLAGMVDDVDDFLDWHRKRSVQSVRFSMHKINFFRIWAETNKVKLLQRAAVVLVIGIVLSAAFAKGTVFEYSYNGKNLGYVSDQAQVARLVDLVNEKMTDLYGAEVKMDESNDFKFKRVLAFGKHIDTSEEVLSRLTYMQDMRVTAYGIFADGVRVATVDTRDTANNILRSLRQNYVIDHPGNYEYVGFASNIEIEPVDTTLSKVENEDFAYQTLSGGSLTIQTLEQETNIIYIPYDTEYRENSSMYVGESRTLVAGVNGEREVISKVVRNNGEDMARLELSSQILFLPTTQVIVKGTKPLPPLQGNGYFIYPVSGYTLTSKFGMRWGRMHYGIDLACPTGTSIRAADGGTVIHSGYSGSYGYMVKIDHGGGLCTIYAHCSKLFVSAGDKVFQGQLIAYVGSTGRSTGPHCHFEVQKNGVAVNPLSYL